MTDRTAVPTEDRTARMWLWHGVGLLLATLVTVGIVSATFHWSMIAFNGVGFVLLALACPAISESLRARRLRADMVAIDKMEKQFQD